MSGNGKFSMERIAKVISDGGTVRLNGQTIAPPPREVIAAFSEEEEYRAFAATFGWTGGDDEPSKPKMVTMPKAEHDALRRDADRLPELLGAMRERPAGVSPEEEAQYQAFLATFGSRV